MKVFFNDLRKILYNAKDSLVAMNVHDALDFIWEALEVLDEEEGKLE